MPCDAAPFSDELIDDALSTASSILYVLSGRQFPGLCTDTVRPCALRSDLGRRSWYRWGMWEWQRQWWQCGCLSVERCGCFGLSQIELHQPLASITEVRQDGEILDPSAYRIDDWRYLVRIDGRSWPCCQNLAAEPDQLDTFQVVYEFGTPPSPGGDRMAAVLACEIAKAWSPELEGECRLPKRVRTLTRQGTTIAIDDPATVFDNGLTGIPEIDLWLRSVNPKVEKGHAVICSPDVPPRRYRRTGT